MSSSTLTHASSTSIPLSKRISLAVGASLLGALLVYFAGFRTSMRCTTPPTIPVIAPVSPVTNVHRLRVSAANSRHSWPRACSVRGLVSPGELQ